MLSGYFKHNGIRFNLIGYDLADSLTFYGSFPLTEDLYKIDRGVKVKDENGDVTTYSATWDRIYISVGSGFISTSNLVEEDGGKLYEHDIDYDFFSTLGSILRGMRSSCCTSNRDDAIDLAVGVLIPNKVTNFTIPNKGTVSTRMSTIISLSYKENDTELFLEEDGSSYLKLEKQTRKQKKIKLDLAGFIQEKEDLSWEVGDLKDGVYSLSEIIERNPEKSYVWLNERKYYIINKLEDLEKVCKEIYNHNGVVSFDTETSGLNFTFKCLQGDGDRLVGMVFSIREGEAWYFPVAHKKIKNICTDENENFIINKYFKPILEKKDLLCHNGAFDWKVMYVYGIFLNLVHDTMIYARVTVWNKNKGMSIALKSLVREFLNRDSFELKDFVEGKWGSNDIKFWDLPFESVKYYACPDTDNTLSLFNCFENSHLLDEYGARKVYEIEVAFSIVIAYQEFYGHCADISRIEDLIKDLDESIGKDYDLMREMAGFEFNPNSSKQLGKILYETLGYPILGYTDSGNPSANAKTLKKLADRVDADDKTLYPFAQLILHYRESAIIKTNFTNKLPEVCTSDGFMFSQVKQFLETGRVSTSDPNYQGYNDVVKKYICARDGFYAFDADYSSVEYRILACMANQTNLIEAFYDPDTDYHTLQASRMFKVPYELVTKILRGLAKGINFGLPYGMGDPSLGERLYGTRSPENTIKAKKMRKVYFEGQPLVEKFFLDARAEGVNKLYSETFFGRRRWFDSRVSNKSSIEREAGNNKIQGTAADIYKLAMIRLLAEVKKRGWLGKVLISCFIHDESFCEIHKSIDPIVFLKMLREAMMLKIEGWCPLYTGAGFGSCWYDAKKTEIPVQVQDMMCDTWGETGLDWWDGNIDRLYDWEVGLINEYKKNRVIDFIKEEEHWHKTLAPVENGFVHEIMSEIKKKHHVDGVVCFDVEESKDTRENLRQFCIAFGLESLFEQADIISPVYSEEKQVDNFVNDAEDEDTRDPSELAIMKAREMGVGINIVEKTIIFKYDEKDVGLLTLVKGIIERNKGSYKVLALKEDGLYNTSMTMDIKGYKTLLSAYLSRRNMLASK